MANLDLSRSALQPRKHYAGVRMQQGRVLTDDDFNEAHGLEAEGDRRSNIDIIGPYGSPDNGFRVEPASVVQAAGTIDFTLQAGTVYLGGHRAELHSPIQFAAQPDFLRQTDVDRTAGAPPHTLVYLELWSQPVSAVEDAELIEVALGAPDTTQRTRTMARVRLHHTAAATCHEAFGELVAALETELRGVYDPVQAALASDLTLEVDFDETADPEDLCAPEVEAGYLGANNAAIRVQLVDPIDLGTPAAFTWGFDNAAPLYRVRIENITELVEGAATDRTSITFITEPKDQAHWPLLSQTAEIVPATAILDPNRQWVAEGHGRCEIQAGGEAVSPGHGHLARVASGYDPNTRQMQLEGHFPTNLLDVPADALPTLDEETRTYNAFLRLWQRGTDLDSAPRIGLTPNVWAQLGNTGLRIRLRGDMIRSDAHWIIGARPNTPRQVVPWDLQLPDGRPPHGLVTHLAPLAHIAWSPPGARGPAVTDCRLTFRPLTRLKGCCTVTVGDGETSHGDYDRIQAAVDALPFDGGQVCVLPGVYEENIVIRGRSNVRVHGCGPRSIIRNTSEAPAILIDRSQHIRIDGLRIESSLAWCIQVYERGLRRLQSTDIEIADCDLLARDYGAVAFDSGTSLVLRASRLTGRLRNEEPPPDSVIGRLPLVWIQARDVVIEDNAIEAQQRFPNPALQSVGGVRVAGRSRDVRLARNRIIGGKGNGVTLGSVTSVVVREEQPGWFYGTGIWHYYWDGNCLKRGWIPGGSIPGTPEQVRLQSEGIVTNVQILDNDIRDMSGDGIGAAWIFDDTNGTDLPDDVILVVGLRIVGNLIEACCEGEFDEISEFVEARATHGPIALADVHDLVVRENRLHSCGVTRDEALTAISAWLVSGALVEGNDGAGNGSSTATPKNQYVGGVGLRFVTPSVGLASEQTGPSALVMHGNRIESPQGHPTAVAGLGAMSIQHNVLSSTLGPSAISPFIGTGLIVISGMGDARLSDDDPEDPRTDARTFGSNLVQVQNNQVHLRAQDVERRSPFYFSVHNLASSATLNVQGNTFFMEGSSFFITDMLAFGILSQVQNNQLTESGSLGLFSAMNAGFLGTLDHNVGVFCFLLYSVFPLPITPREGHQNRSLLDALSIRSEYCARIVKQLSTNPGSETPPGQPPGTPSDGFTAGDSDVAFEDIAVKTRRGEGVTMRSDLFGFATYDSSLATRYVRAAPLQQSYLSAAHVAQGAGLLGVQRRVLEREAVYTTDPELAKQYGLAADEVHAQTVLAREAVFEQVATVRATPPPGTEGISLRGKIRREDGVTVAGGTVSLVDARDQIVAKAIIDDSGWYALRSNVAGAGLRLRVTDTKNTLVATRSLTEVATGSVLVRNIRLDDRVVGDGAKGKRDPEELRRLKERLDQLREARRTQDTQVAAVKLELEDANRTLQELEKEREDAIQKMVSVSEVIEPDDQDKTFRGDLRAATREARRLRIRVRDLDSRITEQRQRRTELADKLTSLEASAESLLLEQEGIQARLRDD